MLPGDGSTDGCRHLAEIDPGVPCDLVDEDQPLLPTRLDREGGPAPRPQGRLAQLRRELEILRIVAAPSNEDQFLEPSGDEQLAAGKEAQVPGSHRARPAGGWRGREHGLERRGFGPVPVSERHALTLHTNLSHPPWRALVARLRIDDHDPLIRPGMATTDDGFRTGGRRRSRDRGVLCERRRLERPHQGSLAAPSSRDEQSCLRQPVAGVERLGAETIRSKGRGETLQGLRPHGLGAVERQLPGREIETRPVALRDPAHAQVVSEVRTATRRGAIAADRREPAQRLLQESPRRHQDASPTDIKRLQHTADQSHVVVQRQPGDDHGLRRLAKSQPDALLVVQQIGVAQDHSARGRRRARGVLEEGDRVAADTGVLPLRGQIGGQPIGRDACAPAQARDFPPRLCNPRQQRRGGEDHPRQGIFRNRPQPEERALGPREVHGDGDAAGVEATEKGRDQLQSGRIQKNDACPCGTVVLQHRRDSAGARVEAAKAELRGGLLAVGEEGIAPPVPGLQAARPQQLDKRFRGAAFRPLR